jgi:CheY-like chemotaxis protein
MTRAVGWAAAAAAGPRRASGQPGRAGARAGGRRTRTRLPPLVLLVDDYVDNREMYAEYLVYAGYRVAQAGNGAEALDLAYELHPDLVVMDLSLPVMDGWEATRQLKANPRTHATPVIALTGHALAGHSRRARQAGCDAFLVKPCMPAELEAVVARMLAGGRGSGSGSKRKRS